jgi:hypothetical protein
MLTGSVRARQMLQSFILGSNTALSRNIGVSLLAFQSALAPLSVNGSLFPKRRLSAKTRGGLFSRREKSATHSPGSTKEGSEHEPLPSV